jgi:hypothetical protein
MGGWVAISDGRSDGRITLPGSDDPAGRRVDCGSARGMPDSVRMRMFLIWSNQHQMWWRPLRRGYTAVIEEAGRYTRDAAEKIVADATLGGQLAHQRTNPVSGAEYTSFDEVLVLAPECTDLAADETAEP